MSVAEGFLGSPWFHSNPVPSHLWFLRHTHTHTYTLGLKHSISGLSAEVNCFWEVWANSTHLVSLRRVWKKSLFFSGRKKITQYTHTHTHTHTYHLGSFKVRLTHTWVGNFVQIGNLTGQPLIWCLQASTEQACAVSVSCGSAEPRPGDSADLAEKRITTAYCVLGTLQSTSLILSWLTLAQPLELSVIRRTILQMRKPRLT